MLEYWYSERRVITILYARVQSDRKSAIMCIYSILNVGRNSNFHYVFNKWNPFCVLKNFDLSIRFNKAALKSIWKGLDTVKNQPWPFVCTCLALVCSTRYFIEKFRNFLKFFMKVFPMKKLMKFLSKKWQMEFLSNFGSSQSKIRKFFSCLI